MINKLYRNNQRIYLINNFYITKTHISLGNYNARKPLSYIELQRWQMEMSGLTQIHHIFPLQPTPQYILPTVWIYINYTLTIHILCNNILLYGNMNGVKLYNNSYRSME